MLMLMLAAAVGDDDDDDMWHSRQVQRLNAISTAVKLWLSFQSHAKLKQNLCSVSSGRTWIHEHCCSKLMQSFKHTSFSFFPDRVAIQCMRDMASSVSSLAYPNVLS